MAKNEAVALVVPAGVLYSVDKKTGKANYALSPKFETSIKSEGATIGEKYQGWMSAMKSKGELCMNITLAFDFWKKEVMGGAVSAGLPLWIHTFIDPSCPVKYGTNGAERQLFTKNKLAVGIESMIKTAREQMKIHTDRQKLIDKGIDPKLIPAENEAPSDAFKTAKKKITSDERLDKERILSQKIVGGFVLLATEGFDMVQVGKAIAQFFPQFVNKESAALNKKGETLQTAATLAVFAAVAKKNKKEEKESPKVETAQFATSVDQLKKKSAKKK